MTERKKLILNKPAAPEADRGDAPAHYRAPVRGAGSAPRKRMSAAEAAQATQARIEAEARALAQAQEAQQQAQEARAQAQAARAQAQAAAPRAPVVDRWPGQRRAAEPARRDQRDPRDQRDSRDPRERQPMQYRDDRPRQSPPPPQEARRDGRRATGLYPTAARPLTDSSAEHDGKVRLSKLMSERGLASRREADEWIEHGWVRVDGQIVSELGSRVHLHQSITIDEAAKTQQAQRVTILIHKPIGYVSGQAEDGYEPAFVLVRPENHWAEGDRSKIQLTRGHLKHLAPAGRLDIDSTGLLVLTQDGRIARELIGEDSNIEKEYLVRVELGSNPEERNISGVFPADLLEKLRHGLMLDGRELKPAKVSWQNEQQLRFVLREGRKRQIRRMCEQVGLNVVGLKRVRMGSIVLGHLPLGQWRFLHPDERF